MPLVDVNKTVIHPATPVAAAKFIHTRIKSSEMKIVKDAAHYINVKQAPAFNDALLKFLAKI